MIDPTGSDDRAGGAADPGPTAGFEQAAVEQLYEGVYYVDLGRRIKYWNPGAERLSGFPSSEVVGRTCHDNLLNHVDAAGHPLCRSVCPLAATMRDGEAREADVFLRHRMGHRVPVRIRVSAVRDREGKIIGGVEVFDDQVDLTSARRELSDLRDLAMTDALTGIPNRRHFEMSLSSRIAELAGYGRVFGLLIADIDRFKVLNDTYGHAAGDAALRTIAQTMLAASRASDDIARIGGEEFALTVVDTGLEVVRAIADRMRAQVARSTIRVDGKDLMATVSIGGTMAELGDTAETVFARADAALYRAKNAGRDRIEIDGTVARADGAATGEAGS